MTTPLRTILDVARTLPLPDAVAIGDSLCQIGRLSTQEVEAAAIGLPPAPGRSVAVAVAALLDPYAESVFESITRVTIRAAGLPAPVSQLNVCDQDGCWIARVDFAWPEQRVIVECDGFEFHHDRDSFERDRARWNALIRAGWRVLVVTWRAVLTDPASIVGLLSDVIG